MFEKLGKFLGGGVGETVKAVADVAGDYFTSADEKRDFEKYMLENKNKIQDRLSKQNTEQNEINKQEGKHRSMFIAGWRPGLAWTGVVSIGAWCFTTLGLAFIAVCIVLFGDGDISHVHEAQAVWTEFTKPDKEEMLTLVLGLAGLAGLRTWDKMKNLTK